MAKENKVVMKILKLKYSVIWWLIGRLDVDTKTKQDCQDRTGRTGQPYWDRRGQLGQDRQDKTGCMEQPLKNS
jgi:hypothetical protein